MPLGTSEHVWINQRVWVWQHILYVSRPRRGPQARPQGSPFSRRHFEALSAPSVILQMAPFIKF